MPVTTPSDRILDAARTTLTRQQAERNASVRGPSIGARSAEMKRRHIARKAARMAMAVGVILVVAMAAGLALDGIGLGGFVLTVLAVLAALGFFAMFPRWAPDLASINKGDAHTMVGRTELWLEAQRPSLPAPAVRGRSNRPQLDGLGAQLQGIDPAEPAVGQVRSLVGEHLPGMIESWRRIPAHLRSEERAGRTADEQLADGLGKISAEIDQITRELASGDLDALAVRGRYLDYRYGDGLEDTPAAPSLAAPHNS
jgi:hypothetical protein